MVLSGCLTGCQSWASVSILAISCPYMLCLLPLPASTLACNDLQMAESCMYTGHLESCFGGGSHSSCCLSPPWLPTAYCPWSRYSPLGQTGCQPLPAAVGSAACQHKSLDQMVSMMLQLYPQVLSNLGCVSSGRQHVNTKSLDQVASKTLWNIAR